MMDLTFKKVAGSSKSAHQRVQSGGSEVGEVWREQVNVIVSKMTGPRRTALRWRWFAKKAGTSETLGRHTRAALLLGAGYKTKAEAIAVMRRPV
ncbi:hypothetical protein AB4Y45_32835 [Paraburkholderia sp. EG287A]|uniref:hypothetical protein n=1 Tax=Paraburkholderia sp. EG287A TaxID=3237012 RepID=UPI0034D27BF1